MLTSVAFAYVLGGVVIALQLDLAGYARPRRHAADPAAAVAVRRDQGARVVGASSRAILVGVTVGIGAARAPTLGHRARVPRAARARAFRARSTRAACPGRLRWPPSACFWSSIYRRYENGGRVALLPVLLGVLVAVDRRHADAAHGAPTAVRPGHGASSSPWRINPRNRLRKAVSSPRTRTSSTWGIAPRTPTRGRSTRSHGRRSPPFGCGLCPRSAIHSLRCSPSSPASTSRSRRCSTAGSTIAIEAASAVPLTRRPPTLVGGPSQRSLRRAPRCASVVSFRATGSRPSASRPRRRPPASAAPPSARWLLQHRSR